MSEDFAEEFGRMVGKGEPEPALAPEPAATPGPEPERTPAQAHNDLLNELLARRKPQDQALMDLLHPRGEEER